VPDANALWNLWNRFRIGDVEIAFGYLFLVHVGLPRLETGEEINDVLVAQEHGLGIECGSLLGFGTTVFGATCSLTSIRLRKQRPIGAH
jgi:hypothetical protein